MSIVIAIIGLGLLVLVHEFGHYIAARLCGMHVLRFSIGFGPALLKIQTQSGMLWQIALLPLGGFVQVEGMGDDEGDSPGSYKKRPLWQRAVMVAAGPMANLLFASAVYFALFASFQASNLGGGPAVASNVIASVEGAAEAAGIKAGDVIIAINGQKVARFLDIRKAVGANETLQIELVRAPEGEKLTYQPIPVEKMLSDVKPRERGAYVGWPTGLKSWPHIKIEVTPEETSEGRRLGVSPKMLPVGAENLWVAARLALLEPWLLFGKTAQQLWEMLRGEQEGRLVSPIQMTSIGADHVRRGWDAFLDLLAFISINLGLMNLLPLPALDGGRLILILAEAVMRRPVPPKFEQGLTIAGVLLLSVLMIWAIFGDLRALF